MKRVKLKTVTMRELRRCNENSEKLNLNRLLDIEGFINDGYWRDVEGLAYKVQLCMHHKNYEGTENPRVYIGNAKGEEILFDMTYEDYDCLYEMTYKVAS